MFSCFNGMIGLCNFHYDHTANFTPKKSRCYQPQSLQNPTWIHVNSTQKSLKTEVMQTCNYKKAAAFCNLLHPRKKLRWIPKKNAIFEAGNFPFWKRPNPFGVIPLQGLSSLVGERCVEGIGRWTATWSPVVFFSFGKIILKKGTECCRWIIDSGKLT